MNAGSRVGTLLVVFLLVGYVGTVGGVGELATTSVSVTDPLEGVDVTDEAEAVYVSEDGDAVLTYEHPHDQEATLEGTLGVETTAGLVYALYGGELPDDGAGVSGDLTARADLESVTSSGTLQFEETGRLTALEAAVDVNHTDRASTSSLDASATVADLETDYSSIRTDGDLEVRADTLTASGTAHMIAREENATARNDSLEVTVAETSEGYTLEVSERRPIESWETDRWNTREDTQQTLDNRFSNIAIDLGGTAEGSLESYRYVEGDDHDVLEYEYDVEYVGVDDQVTELLVVLLQHDQGGDLAEIEARAMADRLAATQLTEGSVSVDRQGPRTDLEWDLELEGYDELVLGTVEIADSIDAIDDSVADRFDAIRETLEVRDQAGLVRTMSWQGSLEDDGELATIDVTVETDTENWAAYTAALDDHGLETFVPRTVATASVETAGESITVDYDAETAADGAFERAVGDLDGTVPGASAAVMAVGAVDGTFGASELARAELTIENGTYDLEAAAVGPDGAFDVTPVVDAEEMTVSSVYVESGGESSTVYVVADGFVGEGPTEAELREREQVGPDTAVYMPGEWDREFPEIDTQRVEAFLETDLSEEDDDGEGQTGVPAVSLLVGALVVSVLVVSVARRWYAGRTCHD